MRAEAEAWDEAYDSDDDSECSYDSAPEEEEEEGPATPTLAYEPFHAYDEDEYEIGLVAEKEPWQPETADDGEDVPYHFHYLAPPPARRRHPFKDAAAEAAPRSRVDESKQQVRLQNIWPEHGWC